MAASAGEKTGFRGLQMNTSNATQQKCSIGIVLTLSAMFLRIRFLEAIVAAVVEFKP